MALTARTLTAELGVGSRIMAGLPFIDRPTVEIDAPPQAVWEALVARLGDGGNDAKAPTRLFVRALGVRDREPSGRFPELDSTIRGFRVASSQAPSRLLLDGRHRFSAYELEFEVRALPDGRSELSAATRAAFPGAGRLYRAAVIGSGAHGRVVARMLRGVKERADATPRAR
jgi:hypothetical protein